MTARRSDSEGGALRQEIPGGTPTGTDERRYGFRKSLEAVKAAVPVIDEADLLCGPAGTGTGLRRVGERWVGLCPLPDHEEKTPSFTVFPDNHWWCFGCNRGGDVLDLHQLAHGYAETWEALVSLATERGVELPERSERWKRAWNRKGEYLDRAAIQGGEDLAVRLFKVLRLPTIRALTPPEELDGAIAAAWDRWYEPRLFAAYWTDLRDRGGLTDGS